MARRNLMETAFGKEVSAGNRVRDFVLETHEIHESCRALLEGDKVTVSTKVYRDGLVAATASIPLEQLIAGLKRIHRSQYRGAQFRAEDFDGLSLAFGGKDPEAVGRAKTLAVAVEDFPGLLDPEPRVIVHVGPVSQPGATSVKHPGSATGSSVSIEIEKKEEGDTKANKKRVVE